MIDHRFGRDQRLDKKVDFDRVFRGASIRLEHDPLRVIALENRRTDSRLGVVIPKRLLPRAVDRNRAKRLIRESFRTTFRTSSKRMKDGFPPMDIIILLSVRPERDVGFSSAIVAALSRSWRDVIRAVE